jgi:FkbM family methyltransferase
MKKFAHDSNCIVDLGMNNGDDSAYYLKTGARVVAVEANPVLCKHAKQRFSSQIGAGQLIIINAAIDKKGGGGKTFFINLDNDHWSSLDLKWASRENSRVREVEVESLSIEQLFKKFGAPKYMKVDVEGADEMVLDQLNDLSEIPFYLSVEDCRFGYRYMSKMSELGYVGFKLLDQSEVFLLQDLATNHAFPKASSGPFGEGVPGDWLSHKEMELVYANTVRDLEGNRMAPRTHWWDIHCRGIEN